ncbi:CpsD/CapB family tyrosine-protein kinase [Roseovarius dicentrarchi]|uniref:CpsD/CapB family tyrosine-protein kinase n=1 Tax=Roseovarius dicentrarchi TaxID=2250573 RepID=UPI000DE8FE86|nr:CpsD/CapB family tyrosine-protein kinase [Roseovarius dicentrarchi]
MLERYKTTSGRRTQRPSARQPQDTAAPDALPFDLELTRRVNGQFMPARWGTRDPDDAPLVDAYYDLQPTEFEGNTMLMPAAQMAALHGYDAGTWDDLATVPFGHGAQTALDAQMGLVQGDMAMMRVFDDLRTQLLQTLHSQVWNRIAVTAPTSGCGATFTAVNLALSISRIPQSRTVLMDLNQRAPAIAPMLDIRGPGDIHRLLSGAITAEDHLVRPSETLALGLNNARPQNPSEILHARSTGEVLEDMIGTLTPDIMLYDLPAMLEHDDLEAFLPQVDGVLLVADATRTLASQITECERRLEGKTNLLGIILNRTRPQARAA